jgi:hypothetical protein
MAVVFHVLLVRVPTPVMLSCTPLGSVAKTSGSPVPAVFLANTEAVVTFWVFAGVTASLAMVVAKDQRRDCVTIAVDIEKV